MRYVTNARNELVVIARSGEVTIHDDNGRERERHKVPYGATLQVKDGDVVKAGKVLAVWDATSRPIVTEYAGRVKFENVEEGVTVEGQVPASGVEHLDGPTLDELLSGGQTLALEQLLLPLGLHVASALHYLAGEGIVHLDVKPSNIVMGGPPRLIDLSVARHRARGRRAGAT